MRAALIAFALLAACDDGDKKDRQPRPTVNAWEIGPTIDGKNYSQGSVNGNVIQVQDVHYVTRATGPLANSVSLDFTLSAPLTQTIPKSGACNPTSPATVTLYFQKRGDDWNTDGNRWWSSSATQTLDRAGTYSITAPLDGPWTSVERKTAATHPQDFAEAKREANRVGFTIGNCEGLGHGGTGPATLTINSFEAS